VSGGARTELNDQRFRIVGLSFIEASSSKKKGTESEFKYAAREKMTIRSTQATLRILPLLGDGLSGAFAFTFQEV
jgi:hypothetical protein